MTIELNLINLVITSLSLDMLCSLDGQFNKTVSVKLPLDFMISFKPRI